TRPSGATAAASATIPGAPMPSSLLTRMIGSSFEPAASVRLILSRKCPTPHILHVLLYGARNLFGEGAVPSDETRMKVRVQSEHVVHHQNLSVTSHARADPDGRDRERRTQLGCQRRR